MARDKTIDRGIFLNSTGWTGKALPWTAGNKGLHEEIAKEQCEHWSQQQIEAAERAGYFADLTQRCQAKRYGSLLDELDDELELE